MSYKQQNKNNLHPKEENQSKIMRGSKNELNPSRWKNRNIHRVKRGENTKMFSVASSTEVG